MYRYSRLLNVVFFFIYNTQKLLKTCFFWYFSAGQ